METITAEKPITSEKAFFSCPACSNLGEGPLCNQCGEELHPKRITVKTLLSSIPDVFFDLESGLFYTVKTFFKRPGAEIKKYFAGDRSRHLKPLKFILITGGLFAFLFLKFDISDGSSEASFEKFSSEITSVILLFQFPIIAVLSWLFFRKRGYTFGEHLVANAFLIGEVIIFNTLLLPLYYMYNNTDTVTEIGGIYILFILAYYTYAFYDWFYEKKTKRGLFISFGIVFAILLIIAFFTEILTAVLFAIYTNAGWY